MSDDKNRAGWDAVADKYQAEKGWPDHDLVWGHRVPPESELRVLGDVRGKSAVVLGCGGGQDVVALAKLGVDPIVAVDASEKMLAHAKSRSTARFVQGTVSDLSFLEDASLDLAVSVHVLTYVENIADCFRETHRVLRPNGMLAFSVHHPIDASTNDAAPYAWNKSYFEVTTDWNWGSLGGSFRSHHRTVTEWFRLVRDAGFLVDEMLEPPPSNHIVWKGEEYETKLGWVPGTLIVRAIKRDPRAR